MSLLSMPIYQYYQGGKKRIWVTFKRLNLRTVDSQNLLNKRKVIQYYSTSAQIMFLCLGNICRSPMAEHYLKQKTKEQDLALTISSAGFIPKEGRKSPKLAIEAGKKFDVDLSNHRSLKVTQSMIEDSDIIFIMDLDNYLKFKQNYKDLNHVFLLKTFNQSNKSVEIKDPYGGKKQDYMNTYKEITIAIDNFLTEVEKYES